jgi:alpha-D-ribose 1-methylphosphonate 5-triphosphate synthase subunit PhnH
MSIAPGFAGPADAQSCFRTVLRAFSRPGVPVMLATALAPPVPLSPAAGAVLLTLTDASTGVSLPAGLRDWLVFHTGARLAAAAAADFVLADKACDLAGLRHGTDDEPEDGATLILDVADFAGPPYRLTGPGIETEVFVRLPVDAAFLAQWRALRGISPRGVDVLFCSGARIIGLPRSTRIEAA